MGQALETLAQESRFVHTILFIGPDNGGYRIGEQHLPDVVELEELRR